MDPPDDADTTALVITNKSLEREGIDAMSPWYSRVTISRHLVLPRSAAREIPFGFFINAYNGEKGRAETEFIGLEFSDKQFRDVENLLGQRGSNRKIRLSIHDVLHKDILNGLDFSDVGGMVMSEGMDQGLCGTKVNQVADQVLNKFFESFATSGNWEFTELRFGGRFSARSKCMRGVLKMVEDSTWDAEELDVANSFLLSDEDVLLSLASLVVTSFQSLTAFWFYDYYGSSNEGSRKKEVDYDEAFRLFSSALKDRRSDSISDLRFIGCMFNESITEHLKDLLKGKTSIKKVVIYGSCSINNGMTWMSMAEALCINHTVQDLAIEGMQLFFSVVKLLALDTEGQGPNTHLRALRCIKFYDTEALRYIKSYDRQSQRLNTHRRALRDIKSDAEIDKEVEWSELGPTLCRCISEADFLEEIFIPTSIPEYLIDVLQALKYNKNLNAFGFGNKFDPIGWMGEEKKLYALLMDVLCVNYGLERLEAFHYVTDYNLSLEAILEERKENRGDWEVMKDMVLVPSTSARVFFCGYPYAELVGYERIGRSPE